MADKATHQDRTVSDGRRTPLRAMTVQAMAMMTSYWSAPEKTPGLSSSLKEKTEL